MSLRGLTALSVVLLVLPLLSGCLDGDSVDSGPDGDPGEPVTLGECAGEPRVSDALGAIEGAVSTQLFEPIADARLILLDESREEPLQETRADAAGSFVFCDLEPAFYVVQALVPGYETTLRGINVDPGEVASLRVQMVLLPSTDPYVIEDDVRGALNWAYWYQIEVPGQGCNTETPVQNVSTCGGSRSAYSTNFRGDFEFVDNQTKTVHVEMVWDPAAVVGENLQLHMFCPEAAYEPGSDSGDRDHPCYYEGPQMTSPIVIRVDENDWLEYELDPEGKWWWHVYAGYGLLGTYPLLGIDVGVAYEQAYTIHISVFQRETAPEGYTRAEQA